MTVYTSLMEPNEVYQSRSWGWLEDTTDGIPKRFGSYNDLLDDLTERDGVWSVHDLRDEHGVLQVFKLDKARD